MVQTVLLLRTSRELEILSKDKASSTVDLDPDFVGMGHKGHKEPQSSGGNAVDFLFEDSHMNLESLTGEEERTLGSRSTTGRVLMD